jgi:hypothetical protein
MSKQKKMMIAFATDCVIEALTESNDLIIPNKTYEKYMQKKLKTWQYKEEV